MVKDKIELTLADNVSNERFNPSFEKFFQPFKAKYIFHPRDISPYLTLHLTLHLTLRVIVFLYL